MVKLNATELGVVFEKHSLPFALITKPEDLFVDPHLMATGGLAPVIMPDGSTTRAPLMPVVLGGARLGVRLNPPRIG